MVDIIQPDESYQIMGAAFDVYNELGCGFLEAVYQECLALEFSDRGIAYVEQEELGIRYKHYQLKSKYKPDFICCENIILEIKAVKELSNGHRAQVHNYLRATDFRLGLLINFGQHPKVVSERIVR